MRLGERVHLTEKGDRAAGLRAASTSDNSAEKLLNQTRRGTYPTLFPPLSSLARKREKEKKKEEKEELSQIPT